MQIESNLNDFKNTVDELTLLLKVQSSHMRFPASQFCAHVNLIFSTLLNQIDLLNYLDNDLVEGKIKILNKIENIQNLVALNSSQIISSYAINALVCDKEAISLEEMKKASNSVLENVKLVEEKAFIASKFVEIQNALSAKKDQLVHVISFTINKINEMNVTAKRTQDQQNSLAPPNKKQKVTDNTAMPPNQNSSRLSIQEENMFVDEILYFMDAGSDQLSNKNQVTLPKSSQIIANPNIFAKKIKNIENSCYINSAIQALLVIPYITNKILNIPIARARKLNHHFAISLYNLTCKYVGKEQNDIASQIMTLENRIAGFRYALKSAKCIDGTIYQQNDSSDVVRAILDLLEFRIPLLEEKKAMNKNLVPQTQRYNQKTGPVSLLIPLEDQENNLEFKDLLMGFFKKSFVKCQKNAIKFKNKNQQDVPCESWYEQNFLTGAPPEFIPVQLNRLIQVETYQTKTDEEIQQEYIHFLKSYFAQLNGDVTTLEYAITNIHMPVDRLILFLENTCLQLGGDIIFMKQSLPVKTTVIFNEKKIENLVKLNPDDIFDLSSAFEIHEQDAKYRVCSAIKHIGSSGQGHYTCVVRNPQNQNNWNLCNDNVISEISGDLLKNELENGYIYILERIIN